MTSVQWLGLAGAATIVLVLFEMLRRHLLREKYAVIWFAIASCAVVVGIAPGLLYAMTDALGLTLPVNLLFFVAAVVLLGLSLQHSHELVRAEERTRTLAEEVALLRLQVEELRPRPSTGDRPLPETLARQSDDH